MYNCMHDYLNIGICNHTKCLCLLKMDIIMVLLSPWSTNLGKFEIPVNLIWMTGIILVRLAVLVKLKFLSYSKAFFSYFF